MTYPPQGPTPPSRYPAPAPHHPVSPPPTHQTPQHPVSPPPSHMTPPPHGQPVSPLTTVPQTSPQHSPPQSAPTSGSPAPQQARPPANGYLLGVDLGTSHTVAVIRWPDGRTRPLLVDGAPVMPSAVFMDESGHIHVGRDAQRLAQTDPARFDPNPKHRIGETSVLLGDREVPVTSLLAAVLRNVASKAVEAVGHLPPAVLTCPAKWGQQRRSILEDAAARAGFPPVKLVPEPVAAAHYFTDVMRQPVPAGSSVAVFDFGGGTLDIAVVRHESDGTFAVLADGGLEDLGGLDIDAALVEYLGRTIAANAPQTWHRLTQPANGTDRRDRRLFWDDVRGAKEMLSRTTVAPVPVPGVEASLHLTRDELERLATPLLERAVAETQRVVTAAGQSPDQLAGLFLVGGSSRMPLAARLLHSQLGMAPTVLEQPEIPVAEGSLAAAFPAQRAEAPVTPPAAPPGAPQESFLEPGPPPTPWYKKKSTWIAAAAAALVVGLLGWWVLHDPYPQHDMRDQLSQVGETTPYPGGEDSAPTPYPPAIDGETAYFPTTAEEGVEVTAVDVNDGGDKWTSDPLAVEDLKEIQAANGIVVLQDQTYDSEKLVFVDPDSGKRLESVDIAEGDTIDFVGETLVRYSTGESRVYGYDSKGDEQWNVKFGELAVADKVDSWKANTEPRGSGEIDDGGFFGGDPERRVWGLDADGTVKVIDAESGDVAVEKKVASPDDKYFAYENRLFVASGTTGYTVTIYDLEEDLKQMATWKPEGGELNPQWFAVCGETRMCVLEDRDGDDTTIEGTSVFDFGESEPGDVWTSEDDLLVKNAEAAGETVKLQIWNNAEDQKVFTQLYDEDFDKLTEEDVEGEFHRIDSGSFLRYPSATEVDTTEVADVVGLGARDGKVYQLGSQPELATCAATDTKLACAGEGGFSIWKFRD